MSTDRVLWVKALQEKETKEKLRIDISRPQRSRASDKKFSKKVEV
jgi:hypothetical protein